MLLMPFKHIMIICCAYSIHEYTSICKMAFNKSYILIQCIHAGLSGDCFDHPGNLALESDFDHGRFGAIYKILLHGPNGAVHNRFHTRVLLRVARPVTDELTIYYIYLRSKYAYILLCICAFREWVSRSRFCCSF